MSRARVRQYELTPANSQQVYAYKLGTITIYPQSYQITTDKMPIVSELWFVMPGRKLIYYADLQIKANKLGLALKRILVPFSMPLDRERRH